MMCTLASELGNDLDATLKTLRHIEQIAECTDLVRLDLILLHLLTLIVLVDLIHHQLPVSLPGLLRGRQDICDARVGMQI